LKRHLPLRNLTREIAFQFFHKAEGLRRR
jgi:hypothetical protein